MMLFILLQVFCLSLAQSQDLSTNNFGSGFDPISLNTTFYKTQVLKTTESYILQKQVNFFILILLL